jgi:hypothetical protein
MVADEAILDHHLGRITSARPLDRGAEVVGVGRQEQLTGRPPESRMGENTPFSPPFCRQKSEGQKQLAVRICIAHNTLCINGLWPKDGLRNRGLGVRIPPGVPLTSYKTIAYRKCRFSASVEYFPISRFPDHIGPHSGPHFRPDKRAKIPSSNQR